MALFSVWLKKKKTFSRHTPLSCLTDKVIVLKHHPDKRRAAGEQILEGDNDYFTCITKGWLLQFLHWVYFWRLLNSLSLLRLSPTPSYRDPVRPREEESVWQRWSNLWKQRAFKEWRQGKLFWSVCSSFWEKCQMVFQKARSQSRHHGVFFWRSWQFLRFLVSGCYLCFLAREMSATEKCFNFEVVYCYRYNFDSWREFSYLDEEEKEKAEW